MIKVTSRQVRKSYTATSSDSALVTVRVYLHTGCTCSNGFTHQGEVATEAEANEIAQKLGAVSVAYCKKSQAKAGQQVAAAPAPAPRPQAPAKTESTKAARARLNLSKDQKQHLAVALEGGPIDATVAHLFINGQPTEDAFLGHMLRANR